MRHERKLSDVLKVVYRRMELDDAANELEVKDTYHKVVGDLISKLTWEVKYEKGVLYVKLASAALRNELMYKRTDLVNKINEVMGRKAVTKIIFR